MAEQHIGRWPIKKLSSLTGHNTKAYQFGTLFLLGAAVAVIHNSYSFALSLPGHHGLELLTALLFARLISPQAWAALIVVTGTVSGEFVLTDNLMHSVKHAPLYFMAGTLIDISYHLLGERCRKLPVAALVGAGVHTAKPLVLMLLAGIIEIDFGFFRHGPIFPLVTYASFGAIGAICGALLASSWLESPNSG